MRACSSSSVARLSVSEEAFRDITVIQGSDRRTLAQVRNCERRTGGSVVEGSGLRLELSQTWLGPCITRSLVGECCPMTGTCQLHCEADWVVNL